MFFEAEIKGRHYKLDVQESISYWLISIRQNGGEKETHRIPKAQYLNVDDAISFIFQNTSYMVNVDNVGLEYTVYTNSSFRVIHLQNDEMILHESLKRGAKIGGQKEVRTDMPGKVVEVLVEPGQKVTADQPLLIMEAMKMENELRAPFDGEIREVLVEKQKSVEAGSVLITFT
jgi:biotin carboxyl carrier protein